MRLPPMLKCLSRVVVVAERQCRAASPYPTRCCLAPPRAYTLSSSHVPCRRLPTTAHAASSSRSPQPQNPCSVRRQSPSRTPRYQHGCAPRPHVFAPPMVQERLLILAPCLRVQDGDPPVACRP